MHPRKLFILKRLTSLLSGINSLLISRYIVYLTSCSLCIPWLAADLYIKPNIKKQKYSLFNRELGKPRDMIKSDMKILRAKAKMRLTFLLFFKREKRAIYGGFRDSLRMVQINLVANTACSGALCVIFSDRGEVLDCMAERKRFELSRACTPHAFQACALNHSATSPHNQLFYRRLMNAPQ